MILYDSALVVNYRDYGIMLPVPPDREKRILEFLHGSFPVMDMKAAFAYLKKENPAINREDLERIHSKGYIEELYTEWLDCALFKTFELFDADGNPSRYEPDKAIRPLSDLFNTLIAQAGGTYIACLLAANFDNTKRGEGKRGFCFYLGGGTHHARYDSGSGFCLINDITAAALKILAENSRIRLIWIIDLDAHKGDGTAELVNFARKRGELQSLQPGNSGPQEKPQILTLSIHMARGWPLNNGKPENRNLKFDKETRAPWIASDVDLGIEAGEEAQYTDRLAKGILKLESLSIKPPDFAIVVDGGDPYEHDSLPSSSLLNLTLDQCLERDIFVYRYLQDRGIPSAWLQSGGYGERAWEPPAHFLKSVSQG